MVLHSGGPLAVRRIPFRQLRNGRGITTSDGLRDDRDALGGSLDWNGAGTQPDRRERQGRPVSNLHAWHEVATNTVVALVESRSGKIWGATGTELFEWTDPLRIRRRDFRKPASILITDIAEDTTGNLWMGTTTGILVLGESGIVQSFTVKDGLPGNWGGDVVARLQRKIVGGASYIHRSGPFFGGRRNSTT